MPETCPSVIISTSPPACPGAAASINPWPVLCLRAPRCVSRTRGPSPDSHGVPEKLCLKRLHLVVESDETEQVLLRQCSQTCFDRFTACYIGVPYMDPDRSSRMTTRRGVFGFAPKLMTV